MKNYYANDNIVQVMDVKQNANNEANYLEYLEFKIKVF